MHRVRLASRRLRPPPLTTSHTPRISIPHINHRCIAFRHPHSSNPHAAAAGTYQPVRFRSPSVFSQKRLLTLALYIITSIAFYEWINTYLTIEIEDEDVPKETAKKECGKLIPEEGESEDNDENLFIPMTWGKKLPREFYRGSDPEWQEFVRVAKDKPRHKKIQDALIQQVFAGSKKHPGVQDHLGEDLKVGRYWLDISFPDGPPQEYKRYGLEFGDSNIYWSAERISPEDQFRLERALWPVAVFNATWAASKAVGGIHYRKIKQYLGVEGVDPFSPEERLRLALETAEKQQAAKNQKGRRGGGELDPAGAVVSRSTPNDDRPAADETKRSPWHTQVPMPSSSIFSDSPGQPSMDLPIFQIIFQTTLQKFWMPKKMEPPRGSFVVQGMMEIRGSKGQLLFDVEGAYDPKEGKFVIVHAHKRNYKVWNQRPMGGP